MNDLSEPDEEALLQRYREQSGVQPSAALDARIMAAARQAVLPKTSLLVRLRRCLGAAGPGRRGSLAFGGVAGMALALGLAWQVLPERREVLQEPMVAAPASGPVRQAAREPLAAMSAPRPVTSQPGTPQAVAPLRSAESRSRSAPADAAEVFSQRSEPARSADAALAPGETAAAMDAGLLEVLRLRGEGREEAAARRLQALQQEYPGVALQQRLEALTEAPAAPGSVP